MVMSDSLLKQRPGAPGVSAQIAVSESSSFRMDVAPMKRAQAHSDSGRAIHFGADRPGYGRPNPLHALLAPRSVAVIGATETEGSVGKAVMQNLSGFSGQVFPIHPVRKTIFNTPAFPNVAALPTKADLAVIATPAATVPGIVQECVQAGITGAVILSAGFKECGPRGADLEKQIQAELRRSNLRVLGPNCLGLMAPHLGLNATFARNIAQAGSVAFLSQSGALCTAILDWSFRQNVGFSAFVSMGSMTDVGWGDLITYFGDDPHTRSIVCYMESVGDARAFLSAAREVALTKPVIVLKVGHTDAAARAAASHTGALTGADAVLDAAFRRAGVLRVNSLGELFDMAEVLAKQPRPRGPRLSIVTNAGGPGALATDMLVSSGGQLAQLTPNTIRALNEFLPPFWSCANPVDILGDADPNRYAKAVDAVAADPETDGLLVILTPQAMTDATATAAQLAATVRDVGKPILTSWMGGPAIDAGKAILNAANIPTFETPDTAARAFALMWQYSDNLRALYETPSLSVSKSDNPNIRLHVAGLIENVRKSKRSLLTEVESKQILSAYGIPAVESRVALNENDAVRHAEELGFPVVAKLFSETITHKSDLGGVHLDLRNVKAVRGAWRSIKKSVLARAGTGHFLGVTIQPMIAHEGAELILGSSIDAQFGPVLMFGTGGKLVEVFQDTVLALPPLNATLARRLMERTRIYSALKGTRGQKAADLSALAQMLVRFSQLVAEQRAIAEIDVNPLLVSGDRMLALDARIILHPAELSEAQLPRLAIQPYPTRYVTQWKPKAGPVFNFRPIRPEDEPLMVRFHQTLSDRSVYSRYFAPLRIEQRIAHERLSRICFIDYDREMALIVERHDAKGTEIVGVGRLSRLHGVNQAEFALLVSDKWQGRGIGAQLLKRLVQIARDEKLERIIAPILPDNRPMQRLAHKAGFKVTQQPDECFAEIVL